MKNLGPNERHTLSVIVDNESGVLARVIGLFSARGYNIDSLTVAEVMYEEAVSRITIVTNGSAHIIEQIKAQLERLVSVHSVDDLTVRGPYVEREIALIKVASKGAKRTEALRIADIYRARVVDSTTGSFIFEITGTGEKMDTFVSLMNELGLVEVARGGVVAMVRGAKK